MHVMVCVAWRGLTAREDGLEPPYVASGMDGPALFVWNAFLY